MRGVPGYMAVDRIAQADAPTGPSRFDRVVVMARAATPGGGRAVDAAGSRGMPAPAQPPTAFQATISEQQPFAPPVGDEGGIAGGPERNDVEQFQQVEPPMPDGPVASPYPNAYPGSPYVGVQRQQPARTAATPRPPPRPAATRRRPRPSSTTRTRRSTSSSAGSSRRSRPRCRRPCRRSAARRRALPAGRWPVRRPSRPLRACSPSRACRRSSGRRRRPRASSSTRTTCPPTGCRRPWFRTAGRPSNRTAPSTATRTTRAAARVTPSDAGVRRVRGAR